jgi:hypothetical protein
MTRSPLVENIEHRFNALRDQGYKTIFMFLNNWGETVSSEAVKPGQYDWAVYDSCRAARPQDYATLVLALDLREPFERQFPDHLRQMESWQALAQTPHVCIPDRTGVNPARARRAFERTALYPPPSLAAATGGASHPTSAPAKRDRSHLSLVIS